MKKSQLTKGEFGEFYSGYIDRLDDEAELISSLQDNTEEMIEFFRNHDKCQPCNNQELLDYRNWLYDCEYDRLLKKL